MKPHLPLSLLHVLLAAFLLPMPLVYAVPPFFGGAINSTDYYPSNENGAPLPSYVDGYSDYAALYSGGAVYWLNADLTLADSATFRNNTAGSYGGAIHVQGDMYCRGGATFDNNYAEGAGGAISIIGDLYCSGGVSFVNNYAGSYGGAIYADSNKQIALFWNESVEFCGNNAATGGAIFGEDSSSISLDENKSVTFNGNTSRSTDGGAIVGKKNSTINLSNNGSVEFSDNIVSGLSSAQGGAIAGGDESTITLSQNESVKFKYNTASAIYGLYAPDAAGGAINGMIGTRITLSENDCVEFFGNKVDIKHTTSNDLEAYGGAYGGAICGLGRSTISLNNNGNVKFSSNTACAVSAGSKPAFGGAIYTIGNLSIRNNDSVLFERNVEITDGAYRLRSIYSTGDDASISLSAANGKSIEFRDSVYIASNSTVELNADYIDSDGVVHKQSGDIIFTGETTETDLYIVKGNQYGTHDEILASRTTEVRNETKLYNGRLLIKEGVIWRGDGITVGSAEKNEGMPTLLLQNGTLRHYESTKASSNVVTINSGAVFAAAGTNVLEYTSLKMNGGSTLTFNIGADNTTVDTAVLTMSNSSLILPSNGKVTLYLNSEADLTQGQSYALLTGISVPTSWSVDSVSVIGGTEGWMLGFDDLTWESNTLWLNYDKPLEYVGGIWTNDSVDGNAYKDGVAVLFVGQGAGRVELVGELAPKNVMVDNDAGKDYTFEGSGSLKGNMKVIKQGAGNLTISTANSYTGGTLIDGGCLIAGSDTAFGTGVIELNKGELNLNGKAAENDLLAKGGIISGGSGFRGAVVFNGAVGLRGNLSASSMTIHSGSILTLNGSTISVSGSLTLAGDAVLNLNGSAFGAGDVLITFGSLSGSEELLTVDYGADSDKYTVEREGNSLILAWLEETQPEEEEKPEDKPLPPTKPEIPAPVLDRESCDALVQSSWGVFTASHAFADAIGGQRSAAGYVGGGRSTAWVSALGGMHRIDGTAAAAGSDIDLYGAAVGLEHFITELDSVGFAVGNVRGDVKLKQSGREMEQTGMYVGVYGTHLLAGFDRNNRLSLKWSAVYGDTTTEGTVGQEKMSWKQGSVQLNARAEWTSQLNNKWSLSVFGGAEYFASDSAENEEGGARLGGIAEEEDRVRMGSIQNLRGELGIGTRYTDGSTTLYGEVRYLNDMVRSNPYADINGVRGYGANPGRQGIGVTVGAQQELGGGWSVSASYSLEAMSEATMHSANIGAALRF